MRRLLATILFLSLAGACYAQGKLPDAKVFVSKDGQCTVEMPGRPAFEKRDPIGSDLEGKTSVFRFADADTEYKLSITSIKSDTLKQLNRPTFYDSICNEIKKTPKVVVVSQSDATAAGNAARVIVTGFQDKSGVNQAETLVVARGRLYDLAYVGKSGADFDAKSQAYFASFKLITLPDLPDTWITYENAESRFRIRMPGKPGYQVIKDDKEYPVKVWTSASEKDKFACITSFNDVKEALDGLDAIQMVLELGAKSVMAELKANVSEIRWCVVDGNPGIDVLFQTKDEGFTGSLNGIARLVLVGRYYYQAMIMCPKDAESFKYADSVLNSFALLKPAAPKTK